MLVVELQLPEDVAIGTFEAFGRHAEALPLDACRTELGVLAAPRDMAIALADYADVGPAVRALLLDGHALVSRRRLRILEAAGATGLRVDELATYAARIEWAAFRIPELLADRFERGTRDDRLLALRL